MLIALSMSFVCLSSCSDDDEDDTNKVSDYNSLDLTKKESFFGQWAVVDGESEVYNLIIDEEKCDIKYSTYYVPCKYDFNDATIHAYNELKGFGEAHFTFRFSHNDNQCLNVSVNRTSLVLGGNSSGNYIAYKK